MDVVDKFFHSILNLPTLPKVVQEVILMLDNEDVDLGQLGARIAHDQVLSAKVLRMANSSYYGVSRTIKTIPDAISVIGVSKLRTLVIASGVTGTFTTLPGLDINRFWRHSLVTAAVAGKISQELKKPTETAYLAALMHSIGQLLIHIVFPVQAAEIDEECKGLSVIERKALENATLGLDHCQVGAELARRWNFPEDIQRVIRYYADPLDKLACDLAPVVFMAAHIAFGLENLEESAHIAETLKPEVAQALGVDRIEWIERIDSYRPLIPEAESFL